MWNIRMRASKSSAKLKVSGCKPKTTPETQNSKNTGMHISGAEGLYEDYDISGVVAKYIARAINHPRGVPDKVVITIESIGRKPVKANILSVSTLKCNSPREAKEILFEALPSLGVSKKAGSRAFKVLMSKKTMRGAALISILSGRRMEPDRERGVRVSRLGIEKTAERTLAKKLSKSGINTTTVKEALILASKVASFPDVIAEICISDDPDYTTGYIASRELGYARIPNIKKKGEMHGGRVFFIKEDADVDGLINYLEKKPVIIAR